MLSDDIVMKNVCEVDVYFYVWYDVILKEYCYYILCGEDWNFFICFYVYYYFYLLDYLKMKKVIIYLFGIYDFISFCLVRIEVEDKICMIYKIDMYEENS